MFPVSLEAAARYYKLAENQKKINLVKARAERLGDLSAKKGALSMALTYFQISGNEARVQEPGSIVEERMEKQEKEMHKTEEQKKQFIKEADELKKEFGF